MEYHNLKSVLLTAHVASHPNAYSISSQRPAALSLSSMLTAKQAEALFPGEAWSLPYYSSGSTYVTTLSVMQNASRTQPGVYRPDLPDSVMEAPPHQHSLVGADARRALSA